MSVPFSNTHLRVPRGFGTVLEGLAREVLRDQPEDIPTYAAKYFGALLRQREESGMDPAEWAAKLEDRYYNNHAFKTATEIEPGQQTTTAVTASQEKLLESQTGDESSVSAEGFNLSSTRPDISEEARSTESTDEEDGAEKMTVEAGNAEGEPASRLPTSGLPSDEQSGTDEERDGTGTAPERVDRTVNVTDSSSVPGQNVPESEDEPTDLVPAADVCAEESGAAEEEGSDEQAPAAEGAELEKSDGEGNNEGAEPSEAVSHPGSADVDVCASELGGTRAAMEAGVTEVELHVVEEVKRVKPQPEATAGEASPSQPEMPESNQREVEDGAGKTREGESAEAGAPSGQTHESLPRVEGDFDCNVPPKEDSLVEISFEDVPEAPQTAEVVQSETSETREEEEPKELNASTIRRNASDTRGSHDLELEGVEKEVDSEGEEVESLHNSFQETEEKAVANDSDFNEDDEKRMRTESVSSTDQRVTEKENQEDKTLHKIEDNENEFHQDEEFKEDQMTGVLKADKDELYKEGYMEMEDQEINDGGAGNNSSHASQSSTSVAPLEAEREKFERSAQDPAEEEEGGPPGESQPGDPEEEKEATSKEAEEVAEEREGEEEEEEGEEVDSQVQERSDAEHPEEKVSLWTAADHQGGSVQNPTESEECSRPQEEEDIMDIPLDDPEANRAAAKIQAGFRGHMTRKKMKPEDKAEGEEVSSTGAVPDSSQGVSETGRSGAVESDDTSVPRQ